MKPSFNRQAGIFGPGLDNPLLPNGSVRIFGFTKEIEKAVKLFVLLFTGSIILKFLWVNNFFLACTCL